MKYIYKVVAALGALVTIPLLLFSKVFYFKMSSIAMQFLGYYAQIKGYGNIEEIIEQNGGELPQYIADSMSFYDIVSLFVSSTGLSNYSDSGTEVNLDAILTPAIVFAIICVIIIVCAIVTFVLAFTAKNNRKVIYSCIVGIGASFMAAKAFGAVAAPILDGTISLSTLLQSWWGGLIGEFEALSLTTFFWFIPLVFGAIILWTVLYNYTLPENEKRERKLMLGEADDE